VSLREVMRPKDGRVFHNTDFSQIELRVATYDLKQRAAEHFAKMAGTFEVGDRIMWRPPGSKHLVAGTVSRADKLPMFTETGRLNSGKWDTVIHFRLDKPVSTNRGNERRYAFDAPVSDVEPLNAILMLASLAETT